MTATTRQATSNLPFARLEGTCFDDSDVRVREVRGFEAISSLSRFDIEVLVAAGEPDTATWEGAAATLCFDVDGVETRRISGEIIEVDDDLGEDTRCVRLVLVPRAHRLTMVRTQEIFMGQSAPDLLRKKLGRVGLSEPRDVELALKDDYPALEFVVQYKESDLDFVRRITEHLGISFFFDPAAEDRIVFTDHPQGFRAAPGFSSLPFRDRGDRTDVFELSAVRRRIPRLFAEQDYNYRTPLVDLTGTAAASFGRAGGVVELGAHVKTPEQARALAKIRAEEADATHLVYRGKSDLCGLTAGAVATIEQHPRLGDRTLLLTSVEHRLSQLVGAHQEDGRAGYECTFTGIDAALPYRPPRVTPKPRIYGLVTGIVEAELAGDEGRFAKIDEMGRYTVRLLFDTVPSGERKPSRPIRMVQPHSGAGYGMHLPLKPGVEVLVAFLDGDPDRPVIVGSVPNPLTPSPVSRQNISTNRIVTETGILIEMKDG